MNHPAVPHSPVLAEIGKVVPGYRTTVVFDVGANVGQSTLGYAATCPEAEIHSFEPVPLAFAELRRRTASHPQVCCWNLALGAARGWVAMTARDVSTGNKVVEARAAGAAGLVEIAMDTGAGFCAAHRIDHISFLKIDTEGHDLAVLRGFGERLRRVDFVQVEAAMNPYNRTHAPFRELEDHLRGHGFLLFRIHGQTFEFHKGGRPVLRRCDPVFINARLVDLAGIQ